MDWTDDAIVLSARKHGESSAIVQLLTAGHGRHAGLVRGGAGRTQRGTLQPGNLVRAHWQARLEDHLGGYRCELVRATAAAIFEDRSRLAALSSACAVAEAALPEREPHGNIHADTCALLAALEAADEGAALAAYVRWEISLLADLGFGLDLTRCGATGSEENLIYVSPRTGRAVSAAAGEPYKDRLLRLPGFLLIADEAPVRSELAAGLLLSGHFLDSHVLAPHGRTLPPARLRLLDRLSAGP